MKDNIAVGAMSGVIGGAVGMTFSYTESVNNFV
jgi:hypothetical protein